MTQLVKIAVSLVLIELILDSFVNQ